MNTVNRAIDHELDRCWTRIGVLGGDKSCEELARYSHCRSCPVFAQAGLGLLDRMPPEGYLERWTEVLATEKELLASNQISVVVFRIGTELLALKTSFFQGISVYGTVHSLPHRKGGRLLGLVNIQGEILPCVSAASVIGVDADTESKARERLIVTQSDDGRWTFPVDEVLGVVRFDPAELVPPPVTVSKSEATFTRGMFNWHGDDIGLLDETLIFNALKRSLAA